METVKEKATGGPNPLPVPADFAERAQLGSNAELREHYGVGNKTLAKWRKIANVPAKVGRAIALANAALPVPEDFHRVAPSSPNDQLALRYRVGIKTISRWRTEAGIAPRVANARLPHRSMRTATQPANTIRSMANDACSFLQATHRPVYHRKIEDKKYEGQYVVGRQIMSEDELFKYAQSKGWKAY